MGIAERKAKEKEDLKALILSGAQKLFIEKGIEQTTIRNIADAIEYSVGTVYVYYKDKNAILHDLHKQGFTLLGGEMRALFQVSEPMERLKAMGRIYIGFALSNPDMYDLMFNMKAPMEFINELENKEWDEGKNTFEGLKTTVQECMEAGYFKGHTLEPLTFLVWGSVHGICSLQIRDRVKGVCLVNPETILMDSFSQFLMLIDKK